MHVHVLIGHVDAVSVKGGAYPLVHAEIHIPVVSGVAPAEDGGAGKTYVTLKG